MLSIMQYAKVIAIQCAKRQLKKERLLKGLPENTDFARACDALNHAIRKGDCHPMREEKNIPIPMIPSRKE